MTEKNTDYQNNERHKELYDEFIQDVARYIAQTIFNQREVESKK